MTDERIIIQRERPYGFWAFFIDCIMTIFTCGLWLIWVYVREMRRR